MTLDELQQENAALKARLRAVEQLLAEHERISVDQAERLEQAISELTDKAGVLDATLNSITDGVAVCDTKGNLTHINPAATQIVGNVELDAGRGEWSELYGLFRVDGVTRIPAQELPLYRALGGEKAEGVEIFARSPERPDGAWLQVSASPVRAADGTMLGAVAVFHDTTERKRWEERERERQLTLDRERNELLQRLQFSVRELSTPVLEVWDDVLVLPVIGIVDSQRSADMMDRLLEAVEHKQCRFVIIDITGVEVIDSATAQQLIKLVTAVEYLGARCVLTGTRRSVAQTLVSLGLELGPITMLRTLKHGLRECMRRMAAEDARGGGKAVVAAAGRPPRPS